MDWTEVGCDICKCTRFSWRGNLLVSWGQGLPPNNLMKAGISVDDLI